MNLLIDLSWAGVKDYLKRDDRVILPLGSVEEHGPHLGLGTDSIEAEAIAHLISEATGVVCAPTLNYGMALSAMGFPGTLSLKPKTLMAVLDDILRSLHHHGFRRILIVNGHGGNNASIESSVDVLATKLPELSFKMVEWWKEDEINQVIDDTMGKQVGSHGSFAETALVMAIRPGAVKLSNLTGNDAPLVHTREMLTVQTFGKFYLDGIMGLNPATATAEAGEIVLKRIVELCVRELNDWIPVNR